MPAPSSRPVLTLTELRRRTVDTVLKAWRDVRETALELVGAELDPSLPPEEHDRLRERMEACLDPKGGEITARAHTAELGRAYLSMNATGRARFLKLLATEFDVDAAAVSRAIQHWNKAEGTTERHRAETALKAALISPRSVMLRQFTALSHGFKFLVDMRADVLELLPKEPALRALEADLKHILSSWFDVGLLDLAEITWHSSSAALLEKLIAYEAVHAIRSWEDLKNRLDADRRIYAFFHPKMPEEPLIFVEVALVEGMAGSIQSVLDTESPPLPLAKADTAIFYSISNAQKGLAGISFGNFLIKRVVSEISAQLPQIRTFATLSPIPGFRAWLDPLLAKGDTSVLSAEETKMLRGLKAVAKADNSAYGLRELLDADWHKDASVAKALKPLLLRLCAHYLLHEKKGDKPLDPVANFHLFNGARLERINWLGDISAKGMKQAAGLMVNYHYKLADIDENHEAFATHGEVVASKQVRGFV